MIQAAGIILLSTKGNVLFVKRADGDYIGSWAIAGGKLEAGESTRDAAIREVKEETGYKVKASDLVPWTRRVSPEVEFTTYLTKGVEEFNPKLNEEHDGFCWAPPSTPPQPLHPGVAISLARFTMNELDIAKAIRDGELTSPQWYENIALFAIRITGTGMAYRVGHDEIAVRNPAHYLTPEFLERCAGLPVILQHPKGTILNTEEYRERNVGSCMLPYIKGDEVWAIAKIYDEPSARMMEATQLSTSPSVVWRGADTQTIEIDGRKYLVEGDPNLLDHIAVCPQGVWDKGGEPVGIETHTSRGDEDMTEFEKWAAEQEKLRLEAQARNDEAIAKLAGSVTAVGGTLGTLTDILGALKTRADEDDKKKEDEKRADARGRADNFKFSKRNDAEEDDDFKKRRDAEEKACADAEEEAGESKEMAADKAKKRRDAADEEDDKDKKAKADSDDKDEDKKRGDEVARLSKELEALKGIIPVQLPMADVNAFAAVQARADAVMTNFGGRARAPMLNESLLSYRRQFINELKPHSDKYKDIDLNVVVANDALLTVVENDIYEAATRAARDPASVKPGELRMRSDSHNGHTIISWDGHPSAWMDNLAGPVRQYATRFLDHRDAR